MPVFSRTVQCFFCQKRCKPANPNSFVCPFCESSNRYTESGAILDTDPSMYDETLNERSFSRRASASTSNLPTMSSTSHSPFCHTCRTNQMLLTNLIANYLPDPSSAEYQHRLSTLPDYRNSLHQRYPPVCADCLPAVEDEIKRKDAMARSYALGSWLKNSRRATPTSVSSSPRKNRISGDSKHLIWWRFRGCLWMCSLICVLAAYTARIFSHQLKLWAPYPPSLLLLFTMISLLWAAWDPTYSTYRISKLQGRDVRVRGKKAYIALQMTSWISRLATATIFTWAPQFLSTSYYVSSLVLELCIFAISLSVIRISQPPQIKLINTQKHTLDSGLSSSSRAGTPSQQLPQSEADIFSTLSLTNNPVLSPSSPAINPVFGLPSLHMNVPPTSSQLVDSSPDDAMDWSPIDSTQQGQYSSSIRSRFKTNHEDDARNVVLGPQRFFAPERPTGLEALLASTLLDDSDNHLKSIKKKWWSWS